jgi:hypothetical protein
MRKLSYSLAGVGATVLGFAGSAFATADTTVTSTGTQVTSFFTDNLPTILTAFVAIAMVIWILGLLFRSVGVKKPSKVG